MAIWIMFDDWHYLERGYAIGVSLGDGPQRLTHVSFPLWRKIVHLAIWASAIGAIVATLLGQRSAWIQAMAALAATLVIGANDIRAYGAMGTPTSLPALLVLAAIAGLVHWRSRRA